MKKFIQISNQGEGIKVTGGLQSINATNYNSPVADRLSVKPAWSNLSVLIKGHSMGYYPSEIKAWDSVQALVKCGVLTLGLEVDECPDQFQAEAEMMKKTLQEAYKKLQHDITKNDEILGKSKKETQSESVSLFDPQ